MPLKCQGALKQCTLQILHEAVKKAETFLNIGAREQFVVKKSLYSEMVMKIKFSRKVTMSVINQYG